MKDAIVEVVVGSQTYGTATPASDTDYLRIVRDGIQPTTFKEKGNDIEVIPVGKFLVNVAEGVPKYVEAYSSLAKQGLLNSHTWAWLKKCWNENREQWALEFRKRANDDFRRASYKDADLDARRHVFHALRLNLLADQIVGCERPEDLDLDATVVAEKLEGFKKEDIEFYKEALQSGVLWEL